MNNSGFYYSLLVNNMRKFCSLQMITVLISMFCGKSSIDNSDNYAYSFIRNRMFL